MRNGNNIPYEKAETAKTCLLELLDELLRDNATMKEIEQLIPSSGNWKHGRRNMQSDS